MLEYGLGVEFLTYIKYVISFVTASDFESRFDGRTCGGTREEIYGNYPTLDEAKFACTNDQECGKVLNLKCDGKKFRLCKNGSAIAFHNEDCIYRHIREKGNISHLENCNSNYHLSKLKYTLQ